MVVEKQNHANRLAAKLGEAYGKMNDMYTKDQVVNFGINMHELGQVNHDFPLTHELRKQSVEQVLQELKDDDLLKP